MLCLPHIKHLFSDVASSARGLPEATRGLKRGEGGTNGDNRNDLDFAVYTAIVPAVASNLEYNMVN